MCCSGRVCMCCTFLILVVVLISFLFGFHVFTDGFHRLKDVFHESTGGNQPFLYDGGRPFLGFGAPIAH
ncbi:uncharacterized protein [Aristolochia californica]|uniref:uncharacterized protein n=1 Tax=Aristolochia californica TaxID=171875 RepID=UPI0035E0BDC5